MPLRGEYGQYLTTWEIRVVQMFANGLTGVEIAKRMKCDKQSIKNHMVIIGVKLAIHRAPGIVAECMRRELIT